MFGKKKNQDQAEASEAVAPAAGKAKKSAKKSFSKGGPGFFASHIEKMIAVLVLAGVGYICYSSFTADGYKNAGKASQLEDEAKQLASSIRNTNRWDAIYEENKEIIDVDTDYVSKVELVRKPIDPAPYALNLMQPPSEATIPRGDPELMAPEQLLAINVFGPIAVEVDKDLPDIYEELPDAEPLKKRSRRSGRNRNSGNDGGGMYGGDMGAGGMGGMGGGGYGGGGSGGDDMYGGGADQDDGPPTRKMTASYDLGAAVGQNASASDNMYGGMGMGMGMGDDAMGGMGGGMGGMGMGGMGGSSASSGRGGLGERKEDTGPKTKVLARPLIFNSILAVMPHEALVEEYREKLENTGFFVADRDMPVYRSFELQRVDVTNDPNRAIDEAEWKTVTDGIQNYGLPKRQGMKWATRRDSQVGKPVADAIDRNAVSTGITMPIPPLLIRDYRSFSRHPLINWSWDSKPLAKEEEEPADEEPAEDDAPALPGDEQPGTGGGGMYGDSMYGGMGGGGGDDMYGGSMGGMGGMGGGGYGGDDMYGGMGGDDMYGGMGGGGGGSRAGSFDTPQPEYKMVRCYDVLNGKAVGKVFRYRLRVLMRDPNYPELDKIPAPDPSSLEATVWARVSKVMEADKKRKEADEKAFRTMLKTPWSAPSPPVKVRAPYEVFAGEVDFAGPSEFEDRQKKIVYRLADREASATVVATRWDSRTGAALAYETDVRRGYVLNTAKPIDLDFIVPHTREIKTMEDAAFQTYATVADIRGGVSLEGGSRSDPQYTNGEIMVLHRDGRLQITNEFDDRFLYRMYTFADEKEASKKSGQSGQGAGGGDDMYGGDGDGGY